MYGHIEREHTVPKYFIDDFGRVWKECHCDNFHYAYFDGWTETPIREPIWVAAKSTQGDDWEEVSFAVAARAIKMHHPDAVAR